MKAISFSILIANYNYAGFVAEAVESCLAQTYPPDLVEVIVVDDGSTDDSLQRLERFRGEPRVRIVAQSNAGQAGAFAAGLEGARGDFICLLDSDDFFAPQKLQRLADRLGALAPLPEAVFLCHDLALFEQESNSVLRRSWFEVVGITEMQDSLPMARVSTTYPFAVPVGQVYSRPLLQAIMRALPVSDWRRGADNPLAWAALLFTGVEHYLHEPLGSYRFHGGNQFADFANFQLKFKLDWRGRWPKLLHFLENFLDSLDLTEDERAERLTLLRRLQQRVRVSSLRPKLPVPRLSILASGQADDAGWRRTLDAFAGQSYRNIEFILPAGLPDSVSRHPLLREGGAAVRFCRASHGQAFLIEAYRAASGEFFCPVAAGDSLDATFAERHLFMHRHMALCMVTCSDYRLVERDGRLVHEACLVSSGICTDTIHSAPMSVTLDKWNFSPRSSNVFRRNAATDCFFDQLDLAGDEARDGAGEWLLLFHAAATGGSTRIAECLATLVVGEGDHVFSVGRGMPRFAGHVALSRGRAADFLFGLLCKRKRQLERVISSGGAHRYLAWLLEGASAATRTTLRHHAEQAGAERWMLKQLEKLETAHGKSHAG